MVLARRGVQVVGMSAGPIRYGVWCGVVSGAGLHGVRGTRYQVGGWWAVPGRVPGGQA